MDYDILVHHDHNYHDDIIMNYDMNYDINDQSMISS